MTSAGKSLTDPDQGEDLGLGMTGSMCAFQECLHILQCSEEGGWEGGKQAQWAQGRMLQLSHPPHHGHELMHGASIISDPSGFPVGLPNYPKLPNSI